MLEKFCAYLTNKIRKEMPDINDERAEIIQYGIELLFGEIPKLLLIIGIAFILKIGWLLLFTYCALLPYKIASGGFHCKTHIGCFLGTCIIYYGTILLSKYITFEPIYLKYVVSSIIWIFGIIMIKLYAPADTENVPILSKKERKRKKIFSYILLTINLIVGVLLPQAILSNILILGTFFQTITITRLAYKLTNNKYGYEVYN